MYLRYSKKKGVNVGNPRHENTVSGLVLCRHDREMLAKSADIWMLGRHVADMLPTFPAKLLEAFIQLLAAIVFAVFMVIVTFCSAYLESDADFFNRDG
jgi:hypothetical protein